MDNLEYWKNEWINVGKDYILNKKTTDESIQIWNESSKTYDESVNNSRVSIISRLEEEGYINKDSTILDIGCGTGIYSIPLSYKCKEVHALDFSDGMLDILEKKIDDNHINNIKLIKGDWNSLDLKKDEMYKKYDFVISSLNPGCYNPESLLKINDASKGGCCYIATDGKGKNQMLHKADEIILGERIIQSDISNIIYPFNILYFNDFNPSLFYTSCNWISKNNYEKAISKLINRYKGLRDIDCELESKIRDFVKINMDGDTFIDESENNLGVILWKAL